MNLIDIAKVLRDMRNKPPKVNTPPSEDLIKKIQDEFGEWQNLIGNLKDIRRRTLIENDSIAKRSQSSINQTFVDEIKALNWGRPTYLANINIALLEAKEKHPTYPTDIFQQLSILTEEAGEVAKAVNDFKFDNGPLQDIKDELYQTAAMCIRMLENLPE